MNFTARIRQCSRLRRRPLTLRARRTRLRLQATQQQQTVTELKGDVTDLKTGTGEYGRQSAGNPEEISEPPTTLHVKGITITPGGFLAAEFVPPVASAGC